MAAANGMRQVSGRHVLWALVLAFGLVVAVNGVMVWLALSSWPGLVSQTPYQDGLAYNEVLADGNRQNAMGWSVAVVEADGRIEAAFDDPAGNPIAGLALSGSIGRPTHEGEDIDLEFVEERPGRYVAELGSAAPGNWNLVIETVRGRDSYRLEQRIYLAP